MTDGARGSGGRPLARVVHEAVRGGVGMVVVRELHLPDLQISGLLEELLPLRRLGVRLLVSRRLDLARAYGLDGVHLGADGVPVEAARAWLGREALIGYSAHSAEEAHQVAGAGSSYVTLSPIYETESKPGVAGRGPGWLATATRGLDVPVLALGGMTADRVGRTLEAGAWGIAAVSAIGAAEDVRGAAECMLNAIQETHNAA